jgi:hypothetical protein
MYQIERRQLDRFKIPGAEILYTLPDGSSSRVMLVDITRSGVRFEINNPVIVGELIELEIIVPRKDKIFIKGHVVWTSKLDSENPAYAVVQFIVFGSEDRYNSMQSYEQLKELSEEYLQTVL